MRAFLFALLLSGAPMLLMESGYAQDSAKARAGENVYNNYCLVCHGDRLVNSGTASYDLRRLRPEDRPRFEQSVNNGKGQMPPWKGALSNEEIDQIWNYIRANAFEK